MAVTGAKQRLMAINVGEVSIVDHPANEEDFVVTKSMPEYEALGIEQGILKAAWTTAYIDNLPDSAFLYISPGGKPDKEGKMEPRSLRHFPVYDDKGKLDKEHLDNALARVSGADVPDAAKEHVKSKGEELLTHWHKVNKATPADVMLDPYTASQVTLDAMRSVIYRIADKIGDPSKLPDVKVELERIKTMLTKAEQFSAAITKALTDVTALVTKAKEESKKDAADGDGGDDVEMARKKGKMPKAMRDELKKFAKVIKDMVEEEADEEDEDDEEEQEAKRKKAMDTVITMVAKRGGKQFSKARLAKLKEMFKHLAATLKEVDPDGYKEMSKDINTGKPATAQSGGEADDNGDPKNEGVPNQPKPAAPANGSANKAGEPSVGASAPAWFDNAIAGLQKSIDDKLAPVTKRVEAIERTEAVSKALPQVTEAPVKKEENMWKGIV